jgi:glycosyltransferase involved in cell wall biosynthesis
MNWLFVTTTFPWPLAHGTHLRIYHLARARRARGDNVALLAGGDPNAPLREEGWRVYTSAGVALPDVGQCAAVNMPGNPYLHDPALAAAVAVHAPAADATVLFRPAAMQYAAAVGRGRACVADFVGQSRQPLNLARGLLRLGRHWAFERRHLRNIQMVTFVSPHDASAFRRRHPRTRVRVVTNGVDVEHFAPPPERGCSPDGRPEAMFLGHLSHPPNADAAWYLLNQVAPRMREIGCAARCVIVGASPPPDMLARRGPDVEITGWVDDVRPYLWRSAVVLLPMRVGTGIKNKLLEAWAAGCAVVATSRACQGIPARHGENLLQVDSPAELAAAVQRLLRDFALRRRLGEAGRRTVLTHFTWPAAAETLRAAFTA